MHGWMPSSEISKLASVKASLALRIIAEQSMEWDSSVYIKCVDYEKAFDSLDRDALWEFLQHYGIRVKFISLIRNTFEDMACKVIHAGQLTDSFMMKTRMSSAIILIPARHRLNHKKDYRKQKKWDPLDILEAVGGPGLCG